jgi:hypothetical protein
MTDILIRAKNANQYVCEKCDFKCSKYSDYTRHLSTRKHQKVLNDTNITPDYATAYICKCGNEYKHSSGLYRHKKVCTGPNTDTNVTDLDKDEIANLILHAVKETTNSKDILIVELLKQNNEFKELLLDQNRQMMELAKNSGTTINNNCNNNNKFNLNVFLNETCKDAITMSEFINSFEVTREDFIRTGKVGFVEGISTVMMKRIRNMELHTRPLHCTDLKRETVYIKNDDKWEKEDIDKTHLRKAVKTVAHKNMNELKRWYSDSKPEVDTIGTDAYENYFKYYQAALGGYDKEEDIKFEEKIIKNVLKEVQVDKTITAV